MLNRRRDETGKRRGDGTTGRGAGGMWQTEGPQARFLMAGRTVGAKLNGDFPICRFAETPAGEGMCLTNGGECWIFVA